MFNKFKIHYKTVKRVGKKWGSEKFPQNFEINKNKKI